MQIFHVTGADCSTCKENIEKAVRAMRGVSRAKVDLAKHFLYVEADRELDSKELTSVIQKRGKYTAQHILVFRIRTAVRRYTPWCVIFAVLMLAYTFARSFFVLS